MKLKEVGSKFGLIPREPFETLLENIYETTALEVAQKSRAEEESYAHDHSEDLRIHHTIGEHTGRIEALKEVIRALEEILK